MGEGLGVWEFPFSATEQQDPNRPSENVLVARGSVVRWVGRCGGGTGSASRSGQMGPAVSGSFSRVNFSLELQVPPYR